MVRRRCFVRIQGDLVEFGEAAATVAKNVELLAMKRTRNAGHPPVLDVVRVRNGQFPTLALCHPKVFGTPQ